ncbi:MAG: MATE family efflux transporter [Polyangiaceae bacterium]|nr:MATE family efflux transporter [Polyangiaceae bacterium]
MAEAEARIQAGALPWAVLRFGTPLALGMGLQTTFNLVDAFLISRLDSEVAEPALGAIGICDQLAALGTILSYGLSIATSAIISRKWGQGDHDGARRMAWQSVLLVGALSVAFGLLGILGARWLLEDVVGAKGEVARLGASYLRVLIGGSFTIFFLLHLTTVQRALGSSKTPVSMLLTANALNLVLAVLMIYGPGEAPEVFSWGPPIAAFLGIPRMELMGAAWATLLARLLVLFPLVLLITKRFGLFRRDILVGPERAALASIWRIGWPSSAQLVVRILAMLFVHSLVARAYTTAEDQSATTALGIVFRLETMALFVGLGWGSAAQTFMGQNLGAGRADRALHSGWYAALYNGLMMAALALAYRAWGSEIVGFFDSRPEVLEVGQSYVATVGPAYVALGVAIVLGSAIQGAGATRFTLRLDTLVVLGFQVPVCTALVLGFGRPMQHLWYAVAATYLAFALVYTLAYRRGRFLETALP